MDWEEAAERKALMAEVLALRHDVIAYRAALGYSAPGDHNGRLSDGTVPNNGIAEALQADLAHYRESERGKPARYLDGLFEWAAEHGRSPYDSTTHALTFMQNHVAVLERERDAALRAQRVNKDERT